MENSSDSIHQHNQRAWDHHVDMKSRWTRPLESEDIERARQGNVRLHLTPKTPLPFHWYGDLQHKKVLALAAGGGQQGPLLAAAGAEVTVLDLSSKQLEQDQLMAQRENLQINLVQAPAGSFPMIGKQSMDLVINPLSNCFFPDLQAVWNECARVLKPGGRLLTAFNNPLVYCFDFAKANRGQFELKYPVPYSDLASLTEQEKKLYLGAETPLEFGHSLTTQIGGLIQAGFGISGFFEDEWDYDDPINRFFPQFIVLKADRIIG